MEGKDGKFFFRRLRMLENLMKIVMNIIGVLLSWGVDEKGKEVSIIGKNYRKRL